jgi:uncharacterized protein (DUF2062 family)
MEVNDDQSKKFRRVRLIKKILKYLPRRAAIHRYPVLNRFADAAKKRSYLWSFRVSEAVPAFYLGWMLTFVPIPTVCQVVVAFALAMLCRANVMILMCLQLLSNTFTFLFLWAITYKTGAAVASIFSTIAVETPQDTMEKFSWTFGNCSRLAVHWLATMLVGALTLGAALGFISSAAYKFLAKGRRKKLEIM